MLKYTDDDRGRILDGIRKYSRIVTQARTRGMNGRDTADIVKAMLSDMLGYDPFFDVTADISARGPAADFAIVTDGHLQFLLIVNPIGSIPNASQLLRLSGAAAPAYAQWLVLTNADVWACYRLGVGSDRRAECAFRVSLLDPSPADAKAALFGLISREAVLDGEHNVYWEQTRVLNPGRIASLLLAEDSLNLLRREIQRTANSRIDRNTLYEILVRDIIRPEALAARSGVSGSDTFDPLCFAYVRNPNDPATWRLRYRNPDGTPNGDLLGNAVAEIDGEGRISGVPPDDIPLVKDRLRSAYFELGVASDLLPVSLRLA